MIKIEVSTKLVHLEDGTEFLSYKAYTKRGWVDLKFPKTVENTPKENCFIFVEKENMNINRKKKFPEIWVKEIKEIKPLEKVEQNISDYFEE